MELGTKFKTSLFGFKKKDVINMLNAYTNEVAAEKNDLNEKISTLSKEITDTNNALKDKSSALDETSNALKQQLEITSNLNKEISELNKVIEEKKIELEKFSLLQKEFSQLKENYNKLLVKNSLLENKAAKYDRFANDINNIMNEAKRTSEKIIEQANFNAEKKAMHTNVAVKTVISELDSFLSELMEIKRNFYNYTHKFTISIEQTENTVNNAKSRISDYNKIEDFNITQAQTEEITPKTVEKTIEQYEHVTDKSINLINRIKKWLQN